jgi:hypothetical protein
VLSSHTFSLSALQSDDSLYTGAMSGIARALGMISMVSTLACGSVGDRATADAAAPADGSPPATLAVAPVAPSAAQPMYQGGQSRFRTASGTICTGRVAASMAGTGFCYLAADNDVRCAGVIGGVDYGMSPSAIGQPGATQILLMFLNNGMCITRADHTVMCMGTNTNAFGAGNTSTTFARWTAHDDVAAIGTGTWDQLCGITLTGQVFCGGAPNFGNPPVNIGPAEQTGLWVDTTGAARLSDTTVLRPAESKTTCQVKPGGVTCTTGEIFGPADGTVVMGSHVSSGNGACWLTDDATVTCSAGRRFAAGKVLYLATSYYSDSLCAIYSDGSVWCIGSNDSGKLGTGNTAPLTTETLVAPPGSAHVACEP